MNNEAWFVSADFGELFHVDIDGHNISFLSKIPQDVIIWRSHPICIKYDNYIYCLPDNGKCVWQYDIYTNEWVSISLKNSIARLNARQYIVIDNVLWFFACGLKCIIKLNMALGTIEDYVGLPVNSSESIGAVSIKNDQFYFIFETSSVVGQYDVLSDKWAWIQFNENNDRHHTLCLADGFMFMSGNKKKLYCFDRECKKNKDIDLPLSFGEYDFAGNKSELLDTNSQVYKSSTFAKILYCQNNIWLIPYRTSHILFMNLEDFELHEFSIPEDNETMQTASRHIIPRKYLILYIRENRFIGLYSTKNECIYDIDTCEKNYKILRYSFCDDDLHKLFSKTLTTIENDMYHCKDLIGDMLYPRNKFRLEVIENNKKTFRNTGFCGRDIYRQVIIENYS